MQIMQPGRQGTGPVGKPSLENLTAIVLDAAAQVAGRPLTPDTDLIAAGFDSLAIIELSTMLADRVQVACSFEDVFDAPTLTALAEHLHQLATDPGA